VGLGLTATGGSNGERELGGLTVLPAFSGPARGGMPVPPQGVHKDMLLMRENVSRQMAQILFERVY